MIRRKEDMSEVERRELRGGEGVIRILQLLNPDEMRNKMKVCGVFTFPPGSGIGEHEHVVDSEIFYVLEGELQVKDNGIEQTLYEGDVLFTADGENHRVWNASDREAKLLAIVMNV